MSLNCQNVKFWHWTTHAAKFWHWTTHSAKSQLSDNYWPLSSLTSASIKPGSRNNGRMNGKSVCIPFVNLFVELFVGRSTFWYFTTGCRQMLLILWSNWMHSNSLVKHMLRKACQWLAKVYKQMSVWPAIYSFVLSVIYPPHSFVLLFIYPLRCCFTECVNKALLATCL